MLGGYGQDTWPEQREDRGRVWGSWPYSIRTQEAGKGSSTHHLLSFSPGLQLTHIQGPSSDIWQHPHGPAQRKVPRSLQLPSNWQWSLTMWDKSSHMKSGSEAERILQTAEILGELTPSGSQVRSAEDEIWAKGRNFPVKAMPLADQWGSAPLLRYDSMTKATYWRSVCGLTDPEG